MTQIVWWITKFLMCVVWTTATPALAEEVVESMGSEQQPKSEASGQSGQDRTQQPAFHFGGFVDFGYSVDFNFPENHLFRNRSTTPRVNELDLNMAGVYGRKDPSVDSRWGAELLVHGGQDSKDFGFGVNLPRLEGSDALPLRHFGRANVSYLAPVGNGLTLQAGLFNSLIGYESLYAKDNFNYTRAWIADYSPYLMFGANAVYPFNDQWTGAFFIINEYFHLQNANNLPSYGVQVAYKPTKTLTVKQTIYYGPDQEDTSLQFWRLFSDSIIEWKINDDIIFAGEYQIGTQEMAFTPGNPRTFYMGGACPMRWHIDGPWSVAVRPEFYWDRTGFHTGAEQFIKAVTTTAEYRLPYKWTNTIVRLEYRYDESTGANGGFFKGTQNALTPGQHMVIVGVILTLDSP
jgi:hypothetical protein